MEDPWFLLAMAVGLYLLVAPLLGIAALVGGRRDRARIGALLLTVEGLKRRLDRLETPPAAEPAPEAPSAPQADEQGPEAGAGPEVEAAPREEAFWPRRTGPESGAAAPPRPASPPSPAGPKLADLEESLTSRWLVWLGAVTLALAGVFLVKYSIDRGWFGPLVRVVLGGVLGAALMAAGEWLRRRPGQRAIAALGPDYVPPALSGAGVFTLFASVYAAYGLYGLLLPLPAFLALAAIAFGAVALALLQGPFIAALGLLGGFATPALVATGNPSAWVLFGYVTALVLAGLALVRWRAWWWLAWGALAGALAWPLLWLAAIWHPGDSGAVGLYLLAIAAAFLLVRHGRGASVELATWRRGLGALATSEQVAWAAALGVAALCFVLVRVDGYDPASLVTWAALTALLLFLGAREAVFDALCLPVAALGLALVATRHVPRIVSNREAFYVVDGTAHGYVPGPLLPPELLPFVLTALFFAALIGLGAFLALWSARRPALWATVSAAIPVLLLAIAYWRITGFETDLGWAVAAVALAAVLVAAARMAGRHRERRGFDAVLGLYAAGATTALALAATMTFEQAWLTVALAGEVLVLAWIHDRLAVRPLRHVALAMAAVVLVRLALNPYVLDYPLGQIPGFNWILYGYGLPAAAFWLAARRFRRGGSDLLVMALEAGAIAFVTLLATFEIRSLVAGSLDSADYRLLERALQTIAWAGLGYGLLLQHRRHGGPVMLWGWRILAGLAAGQTLLLQVVGGNPLWTGEAVGAWPLVNVLALAYLAPAGFALLYASEYRRAGRGGLARAAGLLGLVLFFVYLSLEVRHLFHGPVLADGATGDSELYAYSAAWLAYALALLFIGIGRGSVALRYVSLGVLLFTVAKVFLVDMAALTGLWRVASFLGLGLSLVAIGLLYQRFVFPPRRSGGAQGTG